MSSKMRGVDVSRGHATSSIESSVTALETQPNNDSGTEKQL